MFYFPQNVFTKFMIFINYAQKMLIPTWLFKRLHTGWWSDASKCGSAKWKMLLKTEVLWDVMVCHGVSSFQKGYLKNIGNHRPSDKSRTSHNTCNISNKAL